LVSIELHDGIEANEKSSFEDLSSLCKILFPLRPIRAIDYGAFDDCDSQQWAGGDWEVGICLLQVPCTHHNPPALKAIDDEDFKECLNLKNCEVLK